MAVVRWFVAGLSVAGLRDARSLGESKVGEAHDHYPWLRATGFRVRGAPCRQGFEVAVAYEEV